MSGEGWSGWFVRHGRLRAVWRLALFTALFPLLLVIEVLLLPGLASLPMIEEGRLGRGLVAQGFLTLVAALAATWILLRGFDRRPLRDVGLAPTRRVPVELAAGLAAGATGMLVVVGLLASAGAYRFVAEPGTPTGWLAALGVSLAWLALPAAAEEVLFRGYPLRVLVEAAGVPVAVLITSALFAVLHGWNPGVGPIGLGNIFLAGVLLAMAVLRTGSLWFATAVHLGWNWAAGGLLDLPVSGLDAFDPPLYDASPAAAPVWLTGGAFGPEGGLAGTAAAVLVLALVLWLTRPGARLSGGP